jgi:hypothetical protein
VQIALTFLLHNSGKEDRTLASAASDCGFLKSCQIPELFLRSRGYLDEATASIDGETDAFIQEILRTGCVGTTLATAVPRLNPEHDHGSMMDLSSPITEF